MAKFDKDGDGKLDYEEFKKMITNQDQILARIIFPELMFLQSQILPMKQKLLTIFKDKLEWLQRKFETR